MPKIPELLDMLKAGVHFGHRTSHWHPKMQPYIYGIRGGVHVIDVEKTQVALERVLNYVEELSARGGEILFVGTKSYMQNIAEKYAKEANMPYVNTRWLGGTFTNFPQIEKLIKNYLDLMDKREKGELKKYTKLEQLQFDRKIEELEEKIGGISTLKKLPEAIFVLDVRHDKTAIMEAKKSGIKVIGICDTNINPTLIDLVIPSNNDSVQALNMMSRLISEAVKVGKARAKTAAADRKNREEEIRVAVTAKETVEDLDDQVKEQLAREKEENKK
ncbi:MAG: 30S ribosomal protein S2 [Patescibacteria group bacterium]